MNLIFKVLLIIFAFLFFPLLFIILILSLNWAWLVLWITIPTEIIIALVGLVVYLIITRNKNHAKIENAVDDVIKMVINKFKYDENDPDNFIVENRVLIKDKKGTYDNVLHLSGIGTETQTIRHAIINMNNPEKEISLLINPSEKQIDDAILSMAGYPKQNITREEKLDIDEFGRPHSTIITKQPQTEEQKKMEAEKKEAEEEMGI